MKDRIKKSIPLPVKKFLKFYINKFFFSITFIKRKIRKCFFFFKKPARSGDTFAILCIKRIVYADMAIANINSLHYYNPNHQAVLFCDTKCFDYLQQRSEAFDYPHKVKFLSSYAVADKPWQYYKIMVHIEAAKNNYIDTDADEIWHADLFIDRSKITMLVFERNMRDNATDCLIMERVCGLKEWKLFSHNVAAFVSIPSRLMTMAVMNDMIKYNDLIFTHPLDFIGTEKERQNIRRLSEQYAVNVAIQKNLPAEKILTLKARDGRKNKQILESIYYGWMNRIIE